MQFLFLHPIRVRVVFLLTSMILFTISCEDDDHDHDEEHTDADGFVLEDESGTEVYREFEGAMTGTVTLTVGDTLELTVHFLDHEANEIEHEEEEHEDELKVSENDANIAVVEVESHEDGEEDEEHHEMALHVIGVSTGTTSFKLQLMHEDHADYTSTNNVPVTIN